MKEALCRPDSIHWCIECCPPGCPLLGDTGEGKMGCLGHNGKRIFGGLTERPCCLEVDCLHGFSSKDREEIRQIIFRMAPGEFKMIETLIEFKDERE